MEPACFQLVIGFVPWDVLGNNHRTDQSHARRDFFQGKKKKRGGMMILGGSDLVQIRFPNFLLSDIPCIVWQVNLLAERRLEKWDTCLLFLTRVKNKKGGLKSRGPNKCPGCNLALCISCTTACSVWQGSLLGRKDYHLGTEQCLIFVPAGTEWQFGSIKAGLCWWPTVFVGEMESSVFFLCFCSSARLGVGVVCCLFAISKWQLRNKKDLFAS